MSRSGPQQPRFTIYSSRGGQTLRARTIQRRTAIGALLATASLIALTAGSAGIAINPHKIFGPSQATIEAQIRARLAEDRALTSAARADEMTAQAASMTEQLARHTAALQAAQTRATGLAQDLTIAEAARLAALDAVSVARQRAEAADNVARDARATTEASEARLGEVKLALARANTEILDRLTLETSKAVRLGDTIAELRSSLADREAELASARSRLTNNATIITTLTREHQASTAEITALRTRLENVHNQPVEQLRTELRIAENRLAAERSYTGDVVRWARQTRAQAEHASQQAALALAATRQATSESLRVLTGAAPPQANIATPTDLANVCGDFARVLEASRSMPLTPPFRAGLHLIGATGTGSTVARDAVIRASAAGRVTFAARGGHRDGFVIEIDHGRGITTRYSGLLELSVAQGDQIQASTPLGRVAAATRSGGDTYQIFVDGKPVNPADAIRRGTELRTVVESADERITEAMSLFPRIE